VELFEELIKKEAAAKRQSLWSYENFLPFQFLASQMDDIRTIRKPGDV
jgi:hypothetical protein